MHGAAQGCRHEVPRSWPRWPMNVFVGLSSEPASTTPIPMRTLPTTPSYILGQHSQRSGPLQSPAAPMPTPSHKQTVRAHPSAPVADSSTSAASNSNNGRTNQSARRQQIGVACNSCQVRKGKCDGQRPCKWCRDHEIPCKHEAEAGETLTSARKRKYEDLEHEHLTLLELVNIAALRPDAGEILQQFKNGRRAGDLVILLKEGDITYQNHLGSDPRTRRMLLSLLIQSTASLDEIILIAPRIAEARLDITWEAEDGRTKALKNRTIDADAIVSAVDNLVAPDAPPKAPDPLGQSFNKTDRGLTNEFLLRARPWTKLLTDDALVTHLVTIFLNYNNVYWRYVEQDLFLRSMQSGNVRAEFCSPFLVNAICALACLSSEHGVVFNRPDDLISRGQHFHDEALRLWHLEKGKASVTNIQALVISSMGSGFRGKDKLGLSLLAVAKRMNDELPFPPISAETITISDRTRARVSACWAFHHFDTTSALGLLRVSVPIDTRLSFLPNFPEIWRVWTGEPFLRTNTYFRPNALMRERCQLIRLTAEAVNLLFTTVDGISRPASEKAIKAVMARMEHWYSLLPDDLQFHKNLPAPVYELHGHYYCALITLRSSLDSLQTIPNCPNAVAHSSASPPQALLAVLQATNLLRAFRQTYAFKCPLAFIFQVSAIVSSILLHHLEVSPTASPQLAGMLSDPQDDVKTAFAESYRCLLAIGTRVMIGRGVARMVYHTSRARNTPLPQSTQRLLDVVSDVVWSSTDVKHISSDFPNWGMQKSLAVNEDARMERLLKQWEGIRLNDGSAG
ncbi:hypothetical protein WHR41_07791 [Cladosporium halotolerans]|uniref:Zn(2)-C6 fungal-type domain-containing protein n=1 Tax=Cladosporium halotolerans TaxID=1052096 RepID=A0AB34KES9_9PEZI